jgi:ribosomal protein L7/L12
MMNPAYLVVGAAFLIVLIGLMRVRRANGPRPQARPGILPALSPRVKQIARDPGRKIAAIKAYREETGLGLKDAKDAVEAWQASGEPWRGGPASPEPAWRGVSPPPPLSEHVKSIARDPTGRIEKIAAIKAYRDETGAGLKEAKDAVEAWLATGEPRQGTAAPPASLASGASAAPALSQRVKDAARDPTRRIGAIKAYREETGAGLAEAKDAIEGWLKSQGLR